MQKTHIVLENFSSDFKWKSISFIVSHTISAYFEVINEIHAFHRPYTSLL